MSCMYGMGGLAQSGSQSTDTSPAAVLWDTIDDTIKRKVNTSDASVFAEICGCCPSQVWGVIWLIIAFIFFAAGVLVGLALFKVKL